MSRRLALYVSVQDENGDSHAFGPKDTVPDWALTKITNPDVWAPDEEDPAEAHVTPADLVGSPAPTGGDYDPEVGPPAKAGKGSGKENWVAYAEHHQVEHADDATREDIIAAIDAAGVPVE